MHVRTLGHARRSACVNVTWSEWHGVAARPAGGISRRYEIRADQIQSLPLGMRPTATSPAAVVTVTMTPQMCGLIAGPLGGTYSGPPEGGHVSSAEGDAIRTALNEGCPVRNVASAAATAFVQSSGPSGPQSTEIPGLDDGAALEGAVGTTGGSDGFDAQAAISVRIASMRSRFRALTCDSSGPSRAT